VSRYQGELLNPDFSIPHRLRDGWRPPEPSGPALRHRTVVIGGGVAGLSAAWQLQQSGADDFVVLELGRRAGGTSLPGDLAGFQFPWGAHYVPVPMRENRRLIELFVQMGVIIGQEADGEPLVDESVLCREPEERVFAEGQWIYGLYPASGADDADREQLLRFQNSMMSWASRRDAAGRRMFAIPMSTGSDGQEVRALDRLSMDAWMSSQGFTSERLLWLVDYACRDDYGLTIRQTSAWAALFYFASRLREGQAESQSVMTWPEGNGRITRFLANRCGERLKGSHAVTMIRNLDEGGVLVRVFDIQAARTIDYVAANVVFAAPQFLAPHTIADWAADGRSLKSFRYGGWVVANVHLVDRPAESRVGMCWDNVIADSRSLGYVTSTHQTGRDHGPTVLTWYLPMLDEDPRVSRAELMRLGWSDWASVIVSDLQKAHPDIASLIARIDVMRWGHAMIQPRVGFVWGPEREWAGRSIGRIHFAGTDLSGVALMEEAFDRGVRAADRCLKESDIHSPGV
jgi:hypothetical protein